MANTTNAMVKYPDDNASDANLRLRALELAHESSDTGTADGVIGRAQSYLDFMCGSDAVSVANRAKAERDAKVNPVKAGAPDPARPVMPSQRITDTPAPNDPHYPRTPDTQASHDPNYPRG